MFGKKIKTVLSIEGMSCEHCANKIKLVLGKISDIKKVKINLEQKQAIIISSEKIDINKVKEQIENLDYKVVNIVEENE